MQPDALLLVTLLFGVAAYLLMQGRLTDNIFGFALLSNGVNLLILFTSGSPLGKSEPIVTLSNNQPVVDPLPQALILTAIVIGLGLTAYMVVLAFRLIGHHGSAETDTYLATENDD